MYAPRATTPRPHRFVAGLAATAVVSAGLACMGAANAAGPAFPQTLDFTLSDLVATDTDAYAVGYIGVDPDDNGGFHEVDGYVEAVGSGRQVTLGEGTQPYMAAASPDGDTLYVIGTQADEENPENGTVYHRWRVDTELMTVTSEHVFEPGQYPDAIAVGEDGPYTAYDGEQAVIDGPEWDVVLPEGERTFDLEVVPAAGGTEKVVVGGTDFLEEGSEDDLPILRTISAEGELSDRRVLGPDDDRRGFLTGMDYDEVNDLTYAVTARNMPDEKPQEYTLNVIGADTDDDFPLDSYAFGVEVSPDGDTVYLSGNGVAAYDTSKLDSYDGDNRAPDASFGDGSISQVTMAPNGTIFAAVESTTDEGDIAIRIHALDAPGEPTDVVAAAPEWSSTALVATWAAPAHRGGVDPDGISYQVTLQDNAGGEPIVKTAWEPEREFEDLEDGHTYTLSVATTNGVFTSAPATITYTVAPSVAHPSAINIRGRLAVGSTLSLANTGSWASGTALTYAWYNDMDQVVSTAPTLRLTKAHLGRALWVRVTGTKSGLAPATVYSRFSAEVALGTLAAKVPSVTGKAKVGKVLTAKATGWTSGTRLSYQWLANGKVIKGAKAKTLKLKGAQAGKKITVKVTGTQAGYRTATKTSKATAKVKR